MSRCFCPGEAQSHRFPAHREQSTQGWLSLSSLRALYVGCATWLAGVRRRAGLSKRSFRGQLQAVHTCPVPSVQCIMIWGPSLHRAGLGRTVGDGGQNPRDLRGNLEEVACDECWGQWGLPEGDLGTACAWVWRPENSGPALSHSPRLPLLGGPGPDWGRRPVGPCRPSGLRPGPSDLGQEASVPQEFREWVCVGGVGNGAGQPPKHPPPTALNCRTCGRMGWSRLRGRSPRTWEGWVGLWPPHDRSAGQSKHLPRHVHHGWKIPGAQSPGADQAFP